MSQNKLFDNSEEEYYVIPLIPVIPGGVVHNDTGFCYDIGHECHENPESIKELNQAIQDGEITVEDANRIYQGKTF